jgi:DNA processing protein
LEDAAYWVALRERRGVGLVHARALIERLGSARAAFEAPAARLKAIVPERVAQALARPPDLAPARAELEAARAAGLEPLVQGAAGFPELLCQIADPPLVLYLRGRLPAQPVLAIVGSRRASARGRETARAFACAIAGAGAAVVSGLAYGIDSAAHAGALEAGGATVAVLASGLERPTPLGNARLADRILATGGAWLSEFPVGARAEPFHFPVRNRLISGLARATLIVEARERSGTLSTAAHALEQSRTLLVVPGPIDTDACRGSNRLLREGAGAALDAEDLLLELFGSGRRAAPPPAALPPAQARLLEQLSGGPLDADALARVLGLSPAALAAPLLELELAGLVAREGTRVALGPLAPRAGARD